MNFTEDRQPWVVLEELSGMRQTGHYCDVVLESQGRVFKAHRSILAANSKYFNAIFNKKKVIREKITIKNCNSLDSLRTLLSFMYSGTLVIDSSNHTGLMQLAQQFQMNKVISYCEIYMVNHLTTLNCLPILYLASKYKLSQLETNASNYIQLNMAEVLNQTEMQKLSLKKLKMFLGGFFLDSLNLFKVLLKWVAHDPDKREHYFGELVSLVDWKFVSFDSLKQVDELSLLNSSQTCIDSLLCYLKEHNFELSKNVQELFETVISMRPFDYKNKTRPFTFKILKANQLDWVENSDLSDENNFKSAGNKRCRKLEYPRKVPCQVTRLCSRKSSDTTSTDGNCSNTDGMSYLKNDYSSDSSHNEVEIKPIANSKGGQTSNQHFDCSKCSFSTGIQDAFQHHQLLVHSTDARYKCRECDFTWTWCFDYNKHLKTHYPGPPFQCPECDFSDSKLFHFSEHLFSHTEVKRFECPKCPETFKSPKQVRRHYNKKHLSPNSIVKRIAIRNTKDQTQNSRKHSMSKPMKCEKCTFTCRTIGVMQRHKFLNHVSEKKYKCPECDFMWSLKREYTVHLRTHYKSPPYKCNHCSYVTGNLYCLVPHSFRHSKELQFVCETCVIGFRSLIHLQTHRNRYHRNGDTHQLSNGEIQMLKTPKVKVPRTVYKRGNHKCKKCAFVTITAELLEHHATSVHQEDETFKCFDCEYTSKIANQFYLHMKDHYEGPPYKCKDCSYTSRDMKYFSKHLIKHSKDPQFKCMHCGQFYTTLAGVRLHVDRVHPLITPFACDECDRSFGNENILKEHKTYCHSKVQHLCDICGHRCKDKRYLWRHRLNHSGGRHFCDHPGCNYKTLFENKLLRHKRTHTGERPYVCSFCGKSFIGRNDLNKHEQIHLNIKFDCQKCHASFGAKHYLTRHMKRYHSEGAPCHKTFRPRKKRLFRINDNSDPKDELPPVDTSFPQLSTVPNNHHETSSSSFNSLNSHPQLHQSTIPTMPSHHMMSIDYPTSINQATIPSHMMPNPYSVPAISHEIPTKFRSFMTFT